MAKHPAGKAPTKATVVKEEDRVVLETAFNIKGRPFLRHVKGSLNSGDAVDIGMLLYEAKNENDPFFGSDGFYYFPDHPRCIDALDRLRMVLRSRGYINPRIRIKGAQGERANEVLLPKRVPTMQKAWESVFGGISKQADDEDLTRIADELIGTYHNHLANAAILFVLEDYQPDRLGAKFGVQGEVWGFCQKLGGEFRRLTGYDFKITLCLGVWEVIKPQVRRWLLDLELMHADRDDGGRWGIRDHDIQLFHDEVTRYPKMGALVDKMMSIVFARFKSEEEDMEDDEASHVDIEDDEPEEIVIVPKVQTIPTRRKPNAEPLGISTSMQRALKRHKDGQIGFSVVPFGTLAALKAQKG